MENPCPLILEISSDEEAGFDDSTKGGGAGFGDGEDCDWLSKLLCEVGGNVDDDSDDVVFVSEVFPKAPKKLRSESLKPSLKIVSDEGDGDDDDCVVLDCDPDKPVVLVNSRVEDNDDSDDIEIVGEKGEIACRDFPHPRHLCVKFPFTSTSHEFHCSQCHCYVCDSLAPCSHWSTGAGSIHWSTGTGSIDHCHASDKEEYWKAERKRVKKADKPLSVVSTASGSSLLEAYFPPIHVPALPQPQVNSLVKSQGLNPVTIHPPAMPSNVSVPNPFNRARSHTSGYTISRYKTRSELVSSQSLSTSNNNVVSRELTHRVGSRNPQFFSPHIGLVGASPNNRHSYRNQLNRDPSLKRCRAFQTPIVNGHNVSNQKNVGIRAADSVIAQAKLSSPHSLNAKHPNCLRSQSRLHTRPYSSCLNRDRVQYPSQTPAQVCMNRNFKSTAPLQSNISSQTSGENINNLGLPQSQVFQHNNPAPSQTVASYQSDDGNNFGNQLHLRSVISSHPNVGNDLENHSSQLQGHENPTPLLINDQNNVQQGSYSQDGVDATTDFGFYQNSSLNNENLQILAEESQHQSTEPSETPLLHNIPKLDHHTSVGPVDNIPRQNVVQADYISPIYDADCQFPETTGPDALDFQFDSWMFDNQSLSGALGEPASSNWNVFSPEPAFIDPGNLFDI